MRMAEASLPSEAPDAPPAWPASAGTLLPEQHRPPTARHGQAEEVKSRNLPPAALRRNCWSCDPERGIYITSPQTHLIYQLSPPPPGTV